ncbi:MAG: CPBP family intramembrane glutamic endopeptidase [Anaerolineales bacterium]
MGILRSVTYLFWNTQERRLRAAWRILVQLFIFLALSSIPGVLFASVAVLMSGNFQALLEPTGSFYAWLQVASAIASLLAILISLLIAGKLLDRRPFADFGFHFRSGWWSDLGFGLLLGAFLMLMIFGVEYLAGWVMIVETFQSNVRSVSFSTGLVMSVILFLCVGIYEEAFSRGYHLRNIAEGLAFPALGAKRALVLGWVLSSTIFGALHLGNPGASIISTINISVAGLLLGLGFILTGELAIPIGLHITWNFFQGNVFGFPVSGTTPFVSLIGIQQGGPELLTGGVFGPEAGLIGLLAMLLGGLLIVLWVRRRYGRASIQERLALYFPVNKRREELVASSESSFGEQG